MNHRRNAAWLAGWLCLSLCAGAAVKKGDIRITVVDSQTRSATIDGSGVEKNCDGVNYDAYCHNRKRRRSPICCWCGKATVHHFG